MSLGSRSSITPRRVPQQARGQRRVAGLLRAAACVIAEKGYEPATMCAIAKRADSSIGSLYQFFPNKESVVDALRDRYIKEFEKLWAALGAQAASLTVAELVSRLIKLHIEFAETHAGFCALFEASPAANSSRRRELMRKRVAQALLACNPRMSKTAALRLATVVNEIFKGLLRLYARTDADERPLILKEFKGVLIGYLGRRLNH
jgi:AcrR family transcriptional regulator